ncbi:thioredoxin [Clostridium sp. Marseille-P299]|uniref:thioredoxin n=1 Tax=Clostridium sp. Marseille-P299 TaxID=1805477 RepID=UPI00082C4E55|nr:thioredoxin [Clostridium sp. Marseille-P299]
MVKVLKDSVFNEEVLNKKGIVLVDVFATWCGPCKMLSPIVENIAEEVNDIEVAKIDVDENNEVAQKYQVMSIPTLLLFKDGELMDKSVGFQSKEQILDMIGKVR